MPKPQLLPEELFEDDYTSKFEGLVRRRGLLVSFARDRARLDVGLMLTKLGTVELGGRKVWFQLKGVHTEKITADDISRMSHARIPRARAVSPRSILPKSAASVKCTA